MKADETDASPLRLLQQTRKLAAALSRARDEKDRLTAKVADLEAAAAELRAAAAVSADMERQAAENSAKHVSFLSISLRIDFRSYIFLLIYCQFGAIQNPADAGSTGG